MVTTDIVTVKAYPNPKARAFMIDNLRGPRFVSHITLEKLLAASETRTIEVLGDPFDEQTYRLLVKLLACPAIEELSFYGDDHMLHITLHSMFSWHEAQPYIVTVLEQFVGGGNIENIVEPLSQHNEVRAYYYGVNSGMIYVSTTPFCERGHRETLTSCPSVLFDEDTRAYDLLASLSRISEVGFVKIDPHVVLVKSKHNVRFSLIREEVDAIVYRHVGFGRSQRPLSTEIPDDVREQNRFINDPSNWAG